MDHILPTTVAGTSDKIEDWLEDTARKTAGKKGHGHQYQPKPLRVDITTVNLCPSPPARLWTLQDPNQPSPHEALNRELQGVFKTKNKRKRKRKNPDRPKRKMPSFSSLLPDPRQATGPPVMAPPGPPRTVEQVITSPDPTAMMPSPFNTTPPAVSEPAMPFGWQLDSVVGSRRHTNTTPPLSMEPPVRSNVDPPFNLSKKTSSTHHRRATPPALSQDEPPFNLGKEAENSRPKFTPPHLKPRPSPPRTLRPSKEDLTPTNRSAVPYNRATTPLNRAATPSNRGTHTGSRQRNNMHPASATASVSRMNQSSTGSPRVPERYRPGRSTLVRNPLELSIGTSSLPVDVPHTTWTFYELFEQYGNISYIRLDKDRKAYVVFRPAPQDISWVGKPFTRPYPNADGKERQFSLQIYDRSKPVTMYNSPKENRSYPEQTILPLASIDFGVMKTESLMMIMNTLQGPADDNGSLTLDLKKMCVRLKFEITVPATELTPAISRHFMIQLDIAQMHEMILEHASEGTMFVIMTVDHPPEVYRKTPNMRETHDDLPNGEWNEYAALYRQTDIDVQPENRDYPVQLRKTGSILDTGRWHTYRMKFGQVAASSDSFRDFCQAFADHNVRVTADKSITYARGDLSTSWAWIDSLHNPQEARSSFLDDLMEDSIFLEFQVRYQLEVIISCGILHECNINAAFLTKLAALEPHRAVKLLEKVADRKEHVYAPEDIFQLQNLVSVVDKQRPGYCAKILSATVTPTTIYFSTPVLETSNRVVRRFSAHEDRFLRVKFLDEKHKSRLFSEDDRRSDEIFSRVYRTLIHGIMIGDRHYEFLAFGNSQFREHGAYFFASTDTVSAASIRDWMGNFTEFTNVAKYISRLGLCFTTTRGIPYKVSVERIDDVERNGFNFTDGVGKISPLLADMIASYYKFDYRPSVFQFRMAGCKGVLAVDPSVKPMTVQIRKSQEKFPAPFWGLEIAKTSKFTSANLNVQFILVLSALGISDGVFVDKLKVMLADMEKAMTDKDLAQKLLEKNVDYSQMTLQLSQALGNGFMRSKEPFVMTWLNLWRSWSLKYLKQKQRIFVEQGAYVFGVTDETGTLKGHFHDGGKAFDEERTSKQSKASAVDGKTSHMNRKDSFHSNHGESQDNGGGSAKSSGNADGEELHDSPPLPEIFIQVPNPDAKGGYTVIQDVCILTRSPTLHPGDVRVVRAVDVPALRHLKDCVVLPQTGDRDLANMCSGGDLDGDEYVVSWDPSLIPHQSKWNLSAMDFSTAKPPPRDLPVTVNDMAAFFVNHIKNDKLGQIAVAHKVWADREDDGVQNEKCIELAELHSQAVDYPKTGMPAKLPRRLQVKLRPHWLGSKRSTYLSKKVIGQLYNAVKLENFKPAWELPFDQRILTACVPSRQNFDDAKELKDLYDESMRRIMAQYGIKNEFEVFTTFVQEHNGDFNDFKFAETIGEVSSNLRQQFVELCYQKAGTSATERDWEKTKHFIVAMYTITAQAVGIAVAESKAMVERGGRMEAQSILTFDSVPFMSFPWIFGRDLANIANGRNGNEYTGYHAAKPRPTLPTDPQTRLQMLEARYGPLEPLAEVIMPEGGVVLEGDVLNIHHNKPHDPNKPYVVDGRVMQLGSTDKLDIAATLATLSSMPKGAQRDAVERACRESSKPIIRPVPSAAANASQLLATGITTAQPIENVQVTHEEERLVVEVGVVDASQQPTPTSANVLPTGGTVVPGEDESEVEGEDVEGEVVEIVFDEVPSSMLEEV